MAEYSIIKLKNLSPMHIGMGRESHDFSSTVLHSDTITAALAAMKAQKGEQDRIYDFLQSFKMSSAFPFFKDELFLPTPIGRLNVSINGKEEHQYRKGLKKVKYASLPIWKQLTKGESLELDEWQLKGGFITNNAGHKEMTISKALVNERVGVPRDNTDDSEPFFFEWNYFSQDAGLYVMTDATGAALQEITELFESLGQQGIGTDKSIGGGKFDAELTGSISIDESKEANAQMLLSLYIPTKEEVGRINLEESSYQLILRGGFIAGSSYEQFKHLRKKSVYMMDVGSVLYTSETIEGKIVDLRPEWNDKALHSVYRSGKALSVPIKS
jgi:CRISPR type III-A-associated RAMP protein Csm4